MVGGVAVVVLDSMRKQVEQSCEERAASSSPPWPLHQLPPPSGLLPGSSCCLGLSVVCDSGCVSWTNPPQIVWVMVLDLIDSNTKTRILLSEPKENCTSPSEPRMPNPGNAEQCQWRSCRVVS